MDTSLPFIVYRRERLRDGAIYIGQTTEKQWVRRMRHHRLGRCAIGQDIRAGDDYTAGEIVSRHATRRAALRAEALTNFTVPLHQRVNRKLEEPTVVRHLLLRWLRQVGEATPHEMADWIGRSRGAINFYLLPMKSAGEIHVSVAHRGGALRYKPGPPPPGFIPPNKLEIAILEALADGVDTIPDFLALQARDKGTVHAAFHKLRAAGHIDRDERPPGIPHRWRLSEQRIPDLRAGDPVDSQPLVGLEDADGVSG